jgi:antitoxin FitA
MCDHVLHMSKMIQVRNVPERLHRELTRRARARNQTLTDFIQEVLEREVARPPAEEVFDRIEGREPIELDISPAELIRADRAERDAS